MSSDNFNYLIQTNTTTNNLEDINSLQQLHVACSVDTQLCQPCVSSTTVNVTRESVPCYINCLPDNVPVNIKTYGNPSTSSTITDTMPLILNLDSTQREQITNIQTETSHNGFTKNTFNLISEETRNKTFLRIIEQPINRIRYRYKSEKGSHGGLTGENSTQSKKTYPTIKLENYHPNSQVYIKASLYTNERQPKIHVHKLMGKNCNEDGICTVPLSENMTATFQNLGILFVGKKEVPDIIFQRKLEEARLLKAMVNNGSTHLNEDERHRIREESERESKEINLNSVKICFEAYIYENQMIFPICNPIFSRPIANQKSPDSGELKIIRMDKYSSYVGGDEEIFLLCEKVNKKEIKIRFFENDPDGNQLWEAYGNFTETDVHHQVAIVFRTPPYRNQNINTPVQVFLQLFRPRDGEYSEPRPFTYKPKEFNNEVDKKRKKINQFNCDQDEIKNEKRKFSTNFKYQSENISDQGIGTSNNLHKSYCNVIIAVQ